MVAISHINLFSADIEALSRFYAKVFGFSEVEKYRSPIFRLLDAGGVGLGFNAHAAYELLGIGELADTRGARFLLNVEAGSEDEVRRLTQAAVEAGASLVKEPYLTYYQRFQAVLQDPEGNVFRVNHSL